MAEIGGDSPIAADVHIELNLPESPETKITVACREDVDRPGQTSGGAPPLEPEVRPANANSGQQRRSGILTPDTPP